METVLFMFFSEVLARVFHQFLAEIRVCDGGHRLRALAQALAHQVHHTVLRRHAVDHRARGGNGAAC